MNCSEIQACVERIRSIALEADDCEKAHQEEDALYEKFVRYVAESAPGRFGMMAKLILKTKAMEFPRYCA